MTQVIENIGGECGNRTRVHGFAIRCVTTPPTRHMLDTIGGFRICNFIFCNASTHVSTFWFRIRSVPSIFKGIFQLCYLIQPGFLSDRSAMTCATFTSLAKYTLMRGKLAVFRMTNYGNLGEKLALAMWPT